MDLINNNILELCLYNNIKYLSKKYNIVKDDLLICDKSYLNNNTLMKLSRHGNSKMLRKIVKKYNVTKRELMLKNDNGFSIISYYCDNHILNLFKKPYMYLTRKDLFDKNVFGFTICNDVFNSSYDITKINLTKSDIMIYDLHIKLLEKRSGFKQFKKIVKKYKINRADIISYNKYIYISMNDIKIIKYLILKFKLNVAECYKLFTVNFNIIIKKILSIEYQNIINNKNNYNYEQIFDIIY